MIRKLFNKRINEIRQKFGVNRIRAEADANFFGLESGGKTQIRGNGRLLLTDNELVFGMFKPAKEIVIPLSSITAIDIVKWHLGKSIFQPLLKVYFDNENGTQDSGAWWLANPKEWKALLIE